MWIHLFFSKKKMNSFILETALFSLIFIFVAGQGFDPVFSLYHPSDISHTDRLFGDLQHSESKSPVVVQASDDDDLEAENTNEDQPLVIFEENPYLYHENIDRKSTTTNEQQISDFRFPPPRKEYKNTENSKQQIEYEFQPQENRQNNHEIAKVKSPETTPSSVAKKSENKKVQSPTIIVLPEVTTILSIAKQNESEAIKSTKNISQLAKAETESRILYSASKEIYGDKQLAPPRKQQKDEYDIQFQKIATQTPTINKPLKSRTKAYIIDLESNDKYFEEAKHPTTIVITKTISQTKKPTYAYKTILEGRRAPSQSFTFYQSENVPKQEQSKKPVESEINDKWNNNHRHYGTDFRQTTYGDRQTNYDSGYSATSPDSTYYFLSQSSFDPKVSSSNQQKEVYQAQQAVTKPAFTISQSTSNERVPGVPHIPGNFGYLSNGEPFGPQNVPGRAGSDYPTYSQIPFTNFNCREYKMPGFYADMETGCQIFHTCDMEMRRHSFMCPNGTIFNQEFFTCDWWYNVKCDDAKNFFGLNADLFKDPPKIDEKN